MVIFDQVCQFDSKLMGTNEPSCEDMREAYLVEASFSKRDVDVTIIVGKPSRESFGPYPLLLLRFWTSAINTAGVNFSAFFVNAKKLIPREGVSVSRLGGSSGTLQNQSQMKLFEFLTRLGSFPRKSSAVKFFNCNLYLQCVYISPYSGSATYRTKYSPVHKGGAFNPSQSLVKNYPFLYDFAEAKMISALLLRSVNSDRAMNIHQAAVSKEVGVIYGCDSSSRKKLLREYIQLNTHTLVCHAVGFHRDTFKGQTHSLENKICFIVPRQNGMGRGGAGRDKYVAALLDW